MATLADWFLLLTREAKEERLLILCFVAEIASEFQESKTRVVGCNKVSFDNNILFWTLGLGHIEQALVLDAKHSVGHQGMDWLDLCKEQTTTTESNPAGCNQSS
jgi:hypothetical protein